MNFKTTTADYLTALCILTCALSITNYVLSKCTKHRLFVSKLAQEPADVILVSSLRIPLRLMVDNMWI